MTSNQVLRNMLERAPRDIPYFAELIGKSASGLYKIIEEKSELKYRDAVSLSVHMQAPGLLRHFAHAMGYEVIRMPEAANTKESLEALKKTYEEHSALVSEFLKSLEDGEVTPDELESVQKKIHGVISASLALETIAKGMMKKVPRKEFSRSGY